MMKKKLMSSLSVAALAAVLYANAYVPSKDIPQPDFRGFAKACAVQEMIASSLHNADYITSTHPNTGTLDEYNEHEVNIEQNDDQWLRKRLRRKPLNGQDRCSMQIITVRYMQTRK